MPEAGEDSARTLSSRVLRVALEPGRVALDPCLSGHVYDASDETVSTDRQTKTDASLILVDLHKLTSGYGPNPCHCTDHQSWRKVGGERRGKFGVTFPHSFIFSVHVYSTVLVCIILLSFRVV